MQGFEAVWEAIAIASIVLIMKLPELIWKYRNPPEKLEAERRAYEERVSRPDWDFYERHLQRPVPDALKQLFADEELIKRGGFEVYVEGQPTDGTVPRTEDRHIIDEDGPQEVFEFLAIDPRGLAESWEYYHLNVLPFARGDAAAYFLWPGPNESDAVHSVFEESPSDEIRWRVAPDVAAFVKGIRASAAKLE